MWVESAPGAGSAFIFTLPVRAEDAEDQKSVVAGIISAESAAAAG
jgi:hypothetical protein